MWLKYLASGDVFDLKSSIQRSDGALLHVGATLFDSFIMQSPPLVTSHEFANCSSEVVSLLSAILNSSYTSRLFVPRIPGENKHI